MKKITLDDLVEADACIEERALFHETFPEGAEVTRENIRKAINAGLDLDWFCDEYGFWRFDLSEEKREEWIDFWNHLWCNEYNGGSGPLMDYKEALFKLTEKLFILEGSLKPEPEN